MKLFHQLMLAPAAIGLMSPLAAQANGVDLASSTNAINTYSQQQDLDRFRAWEAQNQVTSINQFSDVQPTSWAYQALSNLIERYGCVAGYPDGTFKGGQPLSRFEAAALLNACLDRVTEVTDELQRLINEFQKELSVLKGRVDGLEKKVGKLEAQQFSTTTKLQGGTDWVLGGVNFGGPNNNAVNGRQRNDSLNGATTFNYDVRLALNTSFTGKDLLFTRLRAGNFANSAFGGNPYNLLTLDRAFPGAGTTTNNLVQIDRLWYRFPLNKEFTAAVGPLGRNTEFLAINPSYYDAQLLDFFQLHGAPGTYNKATGGSAAVIWKQQVKKGNPFFAASTSIIFPNADNGNTGTGGPGQATPGGIFSNNSAGSWLTQVGYQAQQWKATFAWRYGQSGSRARSGTQAAVAPIPFGNGNGSWTSDNSTNNFALGLAWQPKNNGTVVPSISAGWGYSSYAYSNQLAPAKVSSNTTATTAGISSALQATNIAATQSWSVGLSWSDAFAKGNALGVAVGQPTFVTSTRNGVTPFDGNYAWQWWYKFQVSDNISVTPALFYLSNPSSAGAFQGRTNGVNGATTTPNTGANAFGALIQTQFRF